MKRSTLAITLAAALTSVATIHAQNLDIELQRAAQREVATGDLNAAIDEYQRIAESAGSDRALAAEALLYLAEARRKLGDSEATAIYERIVRDYADQTEAATPARERLAAGAGETEKLSRRVWAPEADFDARHPSPDGRYLPFVRWSDGSFGVRDLQTGENRILNQGAWSTDPYIGFADLNYAISHDSQWAAYSWSYNVYELRVAPIDGSEPPRTLFGPDTIHYAAPKGWTPDGQEILTVIEAADRSWRMSMISADEGTERRLKSFGWEGPVYTELSPDGRWAAYGAPAAEGQDQYDVFVLATDGSAEYRVVEHPAWDGVAGWTPDSDGLLFYSDRTPVKSLWLVRLADGQAVGDPELIEPNMGEFAPMGTTRDGSLYYSVIPDPRDAYVARIDERTKSLEAAEPANALDLGGRRNLTWSPDGRFLAMRRARSSVSILSVESGEERVIETNLSELHPSIRIVWTPDSDALVLYARGERNQWGYYQLDLDTEALTRLIEIGGVATVSPDLKRIYRTNFNVDDSQLLVRDLPAQNGISEDRVLLDLPDDERLDRNIVVSPDGEWIALDIFTDEGTRLELVRFDGAARRVLHRANGDHGFVQWSRDGRYVVFQQSGQLLQVPAGGGDAELLATLHDGIQQIAVHPNRDRVAYVAGSNWIEVRVLENFLPKAGG